MKKMMGSTTISIFIILIVMTCSWVILAALFSLPMYIESIYFAFDKVKGHFFSFPILLTLFIFMLLLFLYGWVVFFLKKYTYHSKVLLFAGGVSVVICSIAGVLMYPVGALDLFNYVLMGKLVVFYHQNPFLIPFSEIASLDPLHKYAIFLHVTTGYGPWWLVLTSLTSLLSGTSSILIMVLSYKVMTTLFFLLTGLLLYMLPNKKEAKLTAASLYLLNPFIIFEGIVNAHNDILVGFFIVFAFWLYKKKNILLFLSIILAGLIKLYALALLPLFLLIVIKDKWSKKEIFCSLLLAFTGLLFLYLPFWSKGKLISGIFDGLQNAQVINGYSPYSLVREFIPYTATPTQLTAFIQIGFMGIFFCIFISLLFYAVKTNDSLHSAIGILLAFFLSITIYQPWYVLPVLALLALSMKKSDWIFMIIISAGSLLSYPLSVWTWFHSGWSIFIIHIFLSSFIALPSLLYVGIFMKKVILYRNTTQDLQ